MPDEEIALVDTTTGKRIDGEHAVEGIVTTTRADPTLSMEDDSSRIIVKLIEPDEVPEIPRTENWSFINRLNAVGFTDKKFIKRIENMARLHMIRRRLNMSEEAFDYEKWIENEQVILFAMLQTSRSFQGFERKMISTSTRKIDATVTPKKTPSRWGKVFGRQGSKPEGF